MSGSAQLPVDRSPIAGALGVARPWYMFFRDLEAVRRAFLKLVGGVDGLDQRAATLAQQITTMQAAIDLLSATGATADRPADPREGQPYFDTTLGLPIWFDGTDWIDAAGTVV